MKVLCINCSDKSDLRVGEVYTVLRHQGNFYLLEEFLKAGFGLYFHESQFMPLSETDETDLKKQRKNA